MVIVRTLPADRSASKTAREILRASGASNPDTELVASELVSNALLHGALPITLTIERTNDIVHVAVRDERGDFGAPTEHSYGMKIVRSLALAWGIDPVEGDGKTVWADVAA